MTAVTAKGLGILQHALGLDEYGRGRVDRNRFVTGPGSEDFDQCVDLVAAGMMLDLGPWIIAGRSHVFAVTEAGRGHAREHSPKPPKLTRSQRRYRDFLCEDGDLTFGEWLKRDNTRHRNER